MAQLIWTPAALQDMARLHAFLAPKNRDAAKRAVRAIRKGVETLGAHPEIGRPIEDMPPEFRDWFIPFGQSGYVVRYRFDGGLVAILAVRHGKEAGY
ncbi:MAG: type II toxin-antitoxin system RelE/ParE family toxin [Rhodomicrobium sp.]